MDIDIIIDSLYQRLNDMSDEMSRAAQAVQAVSTGLLDQETPLAPHPRQIVHEILRQCAYLLEASAVARTRLTSAAVSRNILLT